MAGTLEVTYYHHSGFSCAMDDVLLVFDYWRGEHAWVPASKLIRKEELAAFRQVIVFISHAHPDHLDPVVYEWADAGNVMYVISHDVGEEYAGVRVYPGDDLQLDERVSVKVYDSTDLGVSYLVTLNDLHIFHAGDLNFWHWREESTVQEIEQADEDFHKACDPIIGQSIDLAFFPVDPRQGRMYDAGANYFIITVKPRLLVPMHFFNRTEVPIEFARRARTMETEVVALTRIGEKMRLEIEEDGFITVNLLSAPEAAPQMNRAVNLRSFEMEDPFMNTDMPIEISEQDDLYP